MNNQGWNAGEEAEKIVANDDAVQAVVEGRAPEEELCDCGYPLSECDDMSDGAEDFAAFMQSIFPSAEQMAKMRAEQSRERRMQIAMSLSATLNNMSEVALLIADLVDEDLENSMTQDA